MCHEESCDTVHCSHDLGKYIVLYIERSGTAANEST